MERFERMMCEAEVQNLKRLPQLAYGLGFKVALENVIGDNDAGLETLNLFDAQLGYRAKRSSLKRRRRDSDGLDISTIEPSTKRTADDAEGEALNEFEPETGSDSDWSEAIHLADVTPLQTSMPMSEIRDIITREISEDLLILLNESGRSTTATAEEWESVVQSCGASADLALQTSQAAF